MKRWSFTLAFALLLVALTAGSTFAAGSTIAASRDRSLVRPAQLAAAPFRGIVLVSVADSVACTGFVVAPRKVVTAAHCLTRDASRGDYRFKRGIPGNIRLYRAYSSIAGGSQFPSCGVARVWAPGRFVRTNAADRRYGSPAHDFAVLTTAADCAYPRNAVLRLWPTTRSRGQLSTGDVVKLGGYPADPRFEQMTGLNLWRTRGRLQPSGADARLLRTSGFVAQGMSGGPIWRTFGRRSPCGKTECVVGVLTECAVNTSGLCKLGTSPRRAVRITPAVRKAIRRH